MSKKPSSSQPNTSPDPFQFIFPVALGAFASLVSAAALSPDSNLSWLPAATHSGLMLRVLGFSAICGGSVVGLMGGRRFAATPLAGAACALGWVIWSLSGHVRARGGYMVSLPEGTTESAAFAFFLNNVQTYGLLTALAFILASLAARVTARFFDRRTETAPAPEDPGRSGTFRLAMTYPVLLGAVGAGLFFVAGLAALPFGFPKAGQLPVAWPMALWCGFWTALPFGLAAFLVRKYFRTSGTAGFLVAPPLAIAAIAAQFYAAGGHFSLAQPAVLLLWQTSPLAGGAWGALGAAMGYELAERYLGRRAGG